MWLDALLPWFGSFAEQVVLITGASSGIGRQTALTFARQRAQVALVARRRPLLAKVAAEVKAAGGQALIVPADVTDATAAKAAVDQVRRSWGRVDVLVNNAGILKASPVERLPEADLDAMLRVNLFGALFMMQAALPLMHRQGRGTIINIASLGGRRGVPPLGGYCATKFALVGLSEALRTELDPAQIHVGLVMPGVIDTPMAQSVETEPDGGPWPSAFNMPPEWVAAAVVLAARFGLREIAVPPGAATMELLGAMAPGITDTLIRWGSAAGRVLARATRTETAPPARAAKPRGTGRKRQQHRPP